MLEIFYRYPGGSHECDNPGSGSADGDTGDNNDGSGRF